MQALLHELGCVGPAAITIEQTGGRTVSLGLQLRLPGGQTRLKRLVTCLGAGFCLVGAAGRCQSTARCTLQKAHCTLSTVHRTLPTFHCILHIVHYTL